jgi:exopolyphosphatase/guanosine-5'-triphosphate,3'-diphosphate pyrophosphatase
MDVKHLERVDGDGLELWRPVLKSPLPVPPGDAEAVLDALGGRASWPDGRAADLPDLVAAVPGLLVVPVHKTRRHFTLGGCMAELTDIRVAGRATRTVAVESEDAARVAAAVRALGFDPRSNVNVPRGLHALLAR